MNHWKWPSSLSRAEQMEFQPRHAWVTLWTIQNLPSNLSPSNFLPHAHNIFVCFGHLSVQLTTFWDRVGDNLLAYCLGFFLRASKTSVFLFQALKNKQKESYRLVFVGKCLTRLWSLKCSGYFPFFSFDFPITECWQNILTALLWFTASLLLSSSKGHGGPVATKQKTPVLPVSWLLQQENER